ncbi:MAG: GNAT family N-acetyltransferase [Verrucomicrobiae bacterium]|nr:GNAT family N-acetyltransferase [Verrucomicrobiae bacterium]MCB1089176.1 GNAT family N-acetyltransferase [Verrucomicrobiae bacterium]
MSSSIDYQIEPDLDVESFIDVLRRSTLAERRPVEDRDRMETMLRGANLIATARHEGRLVGVARALTDFSFCTYLSDLAVDEAYQKRGIGKALLNQIREASGPDVTTLILLAAPKAVDYYPHIGLTRHDSCWTIPAGTKPTT